MGCIIKYKGQSIPEEQFLQYLNKQIAINQLFESDSNLAHQVYEALGVGQNIKTKKTGLLDYFLNVKKDSVFQELIQIGENLGIGIEEYESDSPLQANWNGKNVTINKTYGKVTSNVIAHEVVHGILHTLTNNDYTNSKLNLKLEKFKTELFDYIEKKGINNLNLPPELRILKLDYIKKMSNQEIVTYAFTDSQFSDFLASIKTDVKVNSNESFWNKLINVFNTALKELGFTSKLDELLDILNTEVPLFNNVQITPQQKQQALQLYSQYLDTIFPDSKVEEMDDNLYISVLNQLEPEQIHILSSKADIQGFKEFVNTRKEYDNLSFSPREQEVKYSFKAVENTLKNINKVNQWYKQLGDTDKFWNKLQQDLQIPKQQINLLRESEGNTMEEKLTNFAANYSYTIEINTAKQNYTDEGEDSSEHSELTVPGGTNYKISIFKIPLIIPSIINHFFHKNQIGWFRSDDKSQPLQGELPYENILKSREGWEFEQKVAEYFNNEEPEATKEQKLQYLRETLNKDLFIESSKTRRILEVQSDWGQKQRKSSEPDINIKYDIQQIINDLQKSGDLKIDCN
jgi:hypothetical protein